MDVGDRYAADDGVEMVVVERTVTPDGYIITRAVPAYSCTNE